MFSFKVFHGDITYIVWTCQLHLQQLKRFFSKGALMGL